MSAAINRNQTVCVGVKFDEASRQAIRIAEQYCRRTNSEMRLVHICENLVSSNLATFAGNSLISIPDGVLQMVQDNIREEAEGKLLEIAKTIKSPVNVTTSVLCGVPGTPAELIEAHALTNQCSMIIVVASPGSYRFVPEGFSCALSLMSRSKLPVMVVSTKLVRDIGGSRLRLVIADDLREQSAAAVIGGCELANRLKDTDIDHLHVNGVDLEAIKATFNSAMAFSHTHLDPAVSAQDVYDLLINLLKTKLEARLPSENLKLVTNAGKYRASVVTNASVTDCLEAQIEGSHANIVVFGRHKSFHAKPFGIGQMPYRAMLAQRCAVVVFPPSES